MKNYKLFCEKKGEGESKIGYFYKIHFNDNGVEDYLICDINMCAKSYRTFDIKFFDLVINKKLQKILFNFVFRNAVTFADYLGNEEKQEKLLTNPTLRILAENEELYIDLLEIFDPDHIKVAMRKYNL
jgi:hypothetical protein